MGNLSRRQFARLVGMAGVGTAVAPLAAHASRIGNGGPSCDPSSFAVAGFGPLIERVPNNTNALADVAGVGDLRGVPLLQLPAGFEYTAISIRGDIMSDGNLVPGDHDGMAVFRSNRGRHVLVRNHELSPAESEAGSTFGCLTANGQQYDSFGDPNLGGGGTSTVIVDRDGLVVEDFVSLGGTIRNCAGGPTPWASWLSCEENVSVPAPDNQLTQKHGYIFEVPATLREAVEPIPLIAAGRMNHEAVSVDPRYGYVYQTEDRGDSAWYRFVPNQQPSKFGDLQQGGELYALVIDPNQFSECTGEPLPTALRDSTTVVDTRGLDRGAAASCKPFVGQPLSVSWVKLDDVDPSDDTLRFEAQAKGAALFWRGEGAWYHRGKHYWVCSGAGDIGEGQVWCFDPDSQTVTLLIESTAESLLDGPDNMTVGIDGTIYLMEDGSSGTAGEQRFGQRVVGVQASGGLFDFCFNNVDTSEFAGGCFTPDGRQFFVNVQGIGITYAIWQSNRRPIYAPQRA